MNIFLSYASEDRKVAEKVSLALRGAGMRVFFDRADVRAGSNFDAEIREGIRRSNFMIVLISSSSIAQGSYTLTELALAK